MANALVQVVPDGGSWKIAVDGEDREERFDTQAEAEVEGRRLARERNAEFQLHSSGGNIREKDSYGADPSEIEG